MQVIFISGFQNRYSTPQDAASFNALKLYPRQTLSSLNNFWELIDFLIRSRK